MTATVTVGFRQFNDRNQLRLYQTIASGQQAILRFLLDGPDLFSTGYTDTDTGPVGAWCLLRLPPPLCNRFSAFCPGGAGFGPVLRAALVRRAEVAALAAWAAHEAAWRGRNDAPLRGNDTLRLYPTGRHLLLPQSPAPTTVRVVRSFILRRFRTRYYHYLFVTGTTPNDAACLVPTAR